ncbi:MAG: DUF4337 domain-containing protein [Magnetococcales bacterium]|nr:DUF4337 domain-containing protein [Magnetococcales bacterium]
MADVGEQIAAVVETTEQREGEESRFNFLIAALTAVLATMLGVFNVKDGNIAQAMGQHQAQAVDTWAHYQFKNVKQHMAENMVATLNLDKARGGFSEAYRVLIEERIAHYQAEASRYGSEKEEIRERAEGHEKAYEDLNYRDDQFDMAEAGIEIAIALLSISALTRRRWLAGVATVFALFGVATGLAGFFGLAFHPDIVAGWLG